MIDLSAVLDAAHIESLQSLFNGIVKNQQHDETLSEANVYKALMSFSCALLEEYHQALQKELAEQGIHI